MRLLHLLFVFFGLSTFKTSAQSADVDRTLYGIHKTSVGGTYSFVKYHFGGPGYDVILTFDAAYGDIWELAFNTENKMFYTYGRASYNSPSLLLEINASTATVNNLGEISLINGNHVSNSICTTDGLTFNQTTKELIGTFDVACGSWRAFRLAKFNLNTFGTGLVVCTQIGQLNNPANLEFDAIAMANNNALQGMDPDIPSNTLKFYETANVSSSIGQTSLQSNFNNWNNYRGIAFNQSEDKIYSFAGQNGLRWLVSCNPSYGSNAYSFSNVHQYNLTGFEVRGLVFGSNPDLPASIDNEELSTLDMEKIEVLVFPNPTHSSVDFQYDGELQFKSILIYDATGKKSYVANMQELTARRIDLSSLGEGVYLIQIVFNNEQIILKRLIKN